MKMELSEIDKIHETVAYLHDCKIEIPEIGIVLGTGLGELINSIQIEKEFSYESIPHFPKATVEHHLGRLILGTLNGKRVIVMQGRFHLYEGYSMQQITFPIRVMKMLGIQMLLLSNVSGGIHLNLKKGDLVLIEDHINLQLTGPLVGKNLDELGPRFPDMSEPYSKTLISKMEVAAKLLGLELKKGVYASVVGPNLETRAEYRFLKIIGADMVGMSTVPEVIVANHMGIPCCALSIITDECDPEHLKKIDIGEIIAIAKKGDAKLSNLISKFLE